MVVKNEQIAPVVHRRRTMLPHKTAAQFAAHDTPIGLHDTEGRTRLGSRCGCRQDPALRVVACQHTQGCMFRAIDAETPIAAMRKEILKLDGPSRRDPRPTQRLIKAVVVSLDCMFHEHLPDDVVDEGRMDSVAAEVACPRQPSQHLRDHRHPTGAFMEESFHRLSIPASRPVEKAIWRL